MRALIVTAAAGVVVCAGLLSGAAPATAGESIAVGHDMPSWSADGRRLVFVGFRSGRLGDLFTIGVDGRGERRLTATPEHEDMPRFSPDGTKIAFVRNVPGQPLNFHVFVMNADGTGQRQVTQGGPPNFSPTWSPDGRRLAFVTTREGPFSYDIHVIDVDGAGEHRIGAGSEPAWSPLDDRIVFTRTNAAGAPRLHTMRPDGTDARPLTDNPVDFQNEMRATWSPDGRTIAFVTERHPPLGNSEIYLVDADGRNGRRLTRNGVPDDTPAWSPDGARLALSRGVGLRPEVYVLPLAGGAARKVTGVNLRFVRMTRSAAKPRAGRFYRVDLVVRPRVDRYADVACYAAVGRQLLDVELGAVVNGRLRCVWHVPAAARGKRLYGFAAIRAGGTQVSRQFTLRIVR